jgi:formate dehydrogenase subunit gamma
MTAQNPNIHFDPAVAMAREREDVAVGAEIVRHRRSSRLMHWSVAATFFLCLLTGMPIWSPIFGWMANIFGGLAVCRWLHPWFGSAYFVTACAMFFHWRKEMVLEDSERGWLGPKAIQYMRYEGDDSSVGKYNGGQKLLFWAVSLAALSLLASGLVLWFPFEARTEIRQAAILLHDITFILFTVAIVLHIYLGTAAEPGTFGSMTRGTVSKDWAKLHHPRWYREVTGDSSRPK